MAAVKRCSFIHYIKSVVLFFFSKFFSGFLVVFSINV